GADGGSCPGLARIVRFGPRVQLRLNRSIRRFVGGGMTRGLALASLAIIALITAGFAFAISSLAAPHPAPSSGMSGMDMSSMQMESAVLTPDVTGPTITIAGF